VEIGLIQEVPGPEAHIRYLLNMALDKIAFLPFAYTVDKWRWQVFAGEITPDRYNDSWWAPRGRTGRTYQPPLQASFAQAFEHTPTEFSARCRVVGEL
jgi:Angiotensin-converting enzyme